MEKVLKTYDDLVYLVDNYLYVYYNESNSYLQQRYKLDSTKDNYEKLIKEKMEYIQHRKDNIKEFNKPGMNNTITLHEGFKENFLSKNITCGNVYDFINSIHKYDLPEVRKLLDINKAIDDAKMLYDKELRQFVTLLNNRSPIIKTLEI